jgi:hypothetical protein
VIHAARFPALLRSSATTTRTSTPAPIADPARRAASRTVSVAAGTQGRASHSRDRCVCSQLSANPRLAKNRCRGVRFRQCLRSGRFGASEPAARPRDARRPDAPVRYPGDRGSIASPTAGGDGRPRPTRRRRLPRGPADEAPVDDGVRPGPPRVPRWPGRSHRP